MSGKLSRSAQLALVFAIVLAVGVAGGATGAQLITGKQIKNGTITAKDLSKSLRSQLARAGATGAAGAPGAKGAPGQAIIRQTMNVESGFAIGTSPVTVAAINDDYSEAAYAGNYSASLTHPAGLGSYLAIDINARIANVSGTGVSCVLQLKQNDLPWIDRASTGTISGSNYYLNAQYPSFTPGDKWAFRLRCQTSSGSGTARGEIGVVAGPVGG
jgi:hypothetical protein